MVSGIRNDNWLARHNSVRLFGRLLTAGIEIQGTANFDSRSFAHNEESNVCFFDRALAEQLRAQEIVASVLQVQA
jgi:phosphatidylserine/phosphatidylglycerophosphate/cardiolipin synthase-like enzyme